MQTLILEGPIFQEPKIIKIKPNKAIFRSVIQTVDEINRNKRFYPKNLLAEGLETVKPKMKTRSFLGELDHPLNSGDDSYNLARQSVVSLERVCHMIKDYEFQGNMIIAEMETLTTPHGKTLLSLLNDKATIGFSLRGMASLQKQSAYNLVEGPLYIISYDAVSTPSHAQAVVDFNAVQFQESLSIVKESEDKKLVCYGGSCYLADHFDKLVETKIIKLMNKWV